MQAAARLFDPRAGRGEVEPQAAFAARAEGAAVVDRDPGFLLDPAGELGLLHPGAGEIDPGKVGAFHGHGGHAGDGVHHLVEKLPVAVEIGGELVHPGGALGAVGGGDHVHAEAVGRDAQRAHALG